MSREDFVRVSECVWEMAPRGGMRVPARIYASEKMLDTIFADRAPEQAENVAWLPGIVGASLAMPDIHWGYGFPIGGVAAFDLEEGVVSPGGVGYDINCGVRLMATRLFRPQVAQKLQALVNEMFQRVPTGVGASGAMTVSPSELRKVAVEGVRWAESKGFASAADRDHIEEGGRMAGADPDRVSDHAWARAREQLGTLGSGNHFLEVGYVSEVYDANAARVLGLAPDQITLIIHCGSRGFGHQICEDHLSLMDRATQKYGIRLPDRQLSCAPVRSPEGEAYLGAMRCAVNYAFANRQIIAHSAREAFRHALKLADGEIGLRTVYEVAHNIAKFETHTVNGKARELCVHRKGATRAYAPGTPETPASFRSVGQPVLIPGDMGRCSYVLVGTDKAMQDTFGSTCHGAGRLMSRKQAIKKSQGRNILRELADKGILVRAQDRMTACEEMPEAYKDVSDVVDACAAAGISRKVAQLKPLCCIKG